MTDQEWTQIIIAGATLVFNVPIVLFFVHRMIKKRDDTESTFSKELTEVKKESELSKIRCLEKHKDVDLKYAEYSHNLDKSFLEIKSGIELLARDVKHIAEGAKETADLTKDVKAVLSDHSVRVNNIESDVSAINDTIEKFKATTRKRESSLQANVNKVINKLAHIHGDSFDIDVTDITSDS